MKYPNKSKTSGEQALTERQVKKLINNCTDVEEVALLSLAITSGMRRADIVRVKKNNFEPEERELSYDEKKKDRIKIIHLPQKTVGRLQRWLNSRASNSKYIFPARQSNSSTGHMSGKTAYNILQRNLEKNDIDNRPFHALRATCVKLCQKKGWTPEETARYIGDNVETVQKHYSTPSREEMKQVSEEKSLGDMV